MLGEGRPPRDSGGFPGPAPSPASQQGCRLPGRLVGSWRWRSRSCQAQLADGWINPVCAQAGLERARRPCEREEGVCVHAHAGRGECVCTHTQVGEGMCTLTRRYWASRTAQHPLLAPPPPDSPQAHTAWWGEWGPPSRGGWNHQPSPGSQLGSSLELRPGAPLRGSWADPSTATLAVCLSLKVTALLSEALLWGRASVAGGCLVRVLGSGWTTLGSWSDSASPWRRAPA